MCAQFHIIYQPLPNWYCEVCDIEVRKMMEKIKELEDKHKKMEIEVQRVVKGMDELIKREKEMEEDRRKDKGKQEMIEKEMGEVKNSINEFKGKVPGMGEIEDVKNRIEEVKKVLMR